MAQSILRLQAVKELTGLSRSTIYLRMKEGSFPKQVSLGARAVGWPDDRIQGWIQSRIDAPRSTDQTT